MPRKSKIIIAVYVAVMVICISLLLPDKIAGLLAATGVMGLVQLYSYLTKQHQS